MLAYYTFTHTLHNIVSIYTSTSHTAHSLKQKPHTHTTSLSDTITKRRLAQKTHASSYGARRRCAAFAVRAGFENCTRFTRIVRAADLTKSKSKLVLNARVARREPKRRKCNNGPRASPAKHIHEYILFRVCVCVCMNEHMYMLCRGRRGDLTFESRCLSRTGFVFSP